MPFVGSDIHVFIITVMVICVNIFCSLQQNMYMLVVLVYMVLPKVAVL